MPAERRFGMDHEHYDWSPVVNRGVLRWPEQARVALCVLVNLEHTEWLPPEGSFQIGAAAPGMLRRPYPDYARLTHREYGHRVGIFRVLKVLEKHGIPATIAMDALTAEHYPYLVRHCLERGCEIIGHGMAATRVIASTMSADDEQAYIQQTLTALSRATGQTPVGWLSPEYNESTRTLQLLARAGIHYVCDWVNDEQPYVLKTPQGALYALPTMLELDDVHALWERRVPIDRYEMILQRAFTRLYRDGAHNGRLLVLHLHPWLIGQPFRVRALERALGTMMQYQGVWAAQGSAIVEWYRQHPPGAGQAG
ncbi:MAG: polysaccharide deacetylase family protein [Candidatus Tectimicrobiota bacterium]